MRRRTVGSIDDAHPNAGRRETEEGSDHLAGDVRFFSFATGG